MTKLRDGKTTTEGHVRSDGAGTVSRERNKTELNNAPEVVNQDKENRDPDQGTQPQHATGTKRKAEDPVASDEPEATPSTPNKSSGIRDTRATPGRMVPPRSGSPNAYRPETDPPSMKSLSPEQPKKKKRMSYAEQDRDFKRQALKDPNHPFHDMHKCYKKGPRGRPTYDGAGFQLDYDKVADRMKPRAYNKKSMVDGMEKHLKKVEQERAKMAAIFFVDGKGPGNKFDTNERYWCDKVSKDLDVPWHKVDSKTFEEWENKGFEKQSAEDWEEVSEEDRKRMNRMGQGSLLRK